METKMAKIPAYSSCRSVFEGHSSRVVRLDLWPLKRMLIGSIPRRAPLIFKEFMCNIIFEINHEL